METKVKNNGQAKVANTVAADKTPKFIAGNPVNALTKAQEKKEEAKPEETAVPANPASGQEAQKEASSKLEIKVDIPINLIAFSD